MKNNTLHWPNNKKFAFTFVDDTDNATVNNIKPIYDKLHELNILGTKTVWVYPPRDHFNGQSLQDQDYLDFIQSLKNNGFEIAMHGVGSGHYSRQEILQGFELYKEQLGEYPRMHINHSQNTSNIYWGKNRLPPLARSVYTRLKGKEKKFSGEDNNSDNYWADLCKKRIDYIRNWCFNDVNTLAQDPLMPYQEKSKISGSNYWFSGSNGNRLADFKKLIAPESLDTLEEQSGLCIVYTHFGTDFCNTSGHLDQEFSTLLEKLAHRDCWFAPASNILDHLKESRCSHKSSPSIIYPYTLLAKKYLLRR